MLNIYDTDACLPLHRRKLLEIGTLGLGGLSLPGILAAKSDATNPLKGKSVIFLFQQGGPSQLETFDPKPDAPSAIRTIGGTIPTSIPGIHFGATMFQLAKLAHKLAIVRSFSTGNAGHNIQPVVSPASKDANIGCHFARIAGTSHPLTGTPTNAILYPAAVSKEVPGPSARGDLKSTGPFSKSYQPFVPGSGGKLQQDMQLQLSRERFLHDRSALLSKLDQANRATESNGEFQNLDDLNQQAVQLLLGGGVSNALDLSQEDPRTVALYDTAKYHGKRNWHKTNRGRAGLYNAQASTIGKLLLTARRLCESGCGFVTIHASYAGVWDMHADGNNLNMVDGMRAVGQSFDHAVAAFIQDTQSRGLQDDILLVCCGEMGRTPRINKGGGRDHWAKLAPLLLYGGGIGEGKVIGQSDKQGGEPADTPCGSGHLISTILRTLLDPGKLRLAPSTPAEVSELLNHPTIPGLG
jgi:uncharacterized protein (DUF1501 family)